ncbi:YecR family lipoprotein [Croceicoccus estronivorus]|uniref:YecR family lipoprotein n=1 Tax=Croceicoccus estronivorus TaxID=1172626 RepID=UPI0038B355A8
MSATGGSKADGVVEMSYEYGEFEEPVVNPQQGVEAATKRCKAWGYKTAEAFDGGINTCVIPGGLGGCSTMRTTVSYQCTN